VARLLADENFPFRVVEELRRRGHDAATMLDVGHANEGLPDDGVLALAVAARRAVITLNRRHFVRLHADKPAHSGIVVCTLDPDVAAFAARIHTAISAPPTLDRLLIRITRPSK